MTTPDDLSIMRTSPRQRGLIRRATDRVPGSAAVLASFSAALGLYVLAEIEARRVALGLMALVAVLLMALAVDRYRAENERRRGT